MYSRALLFVIFITLSLTSLAQYEADFEASYPERFCKLRSTLYKQMEHRSLARKNQLLAEFENAARTHNDERAELMAAFFRFSMRMDDTLFTEKSMFDIANPALKKCDDLSFDGLKAFVLMTIGYYYAEKNNAGLALYYLLKAHTVYSVLPYEAFDFKAVVLANLGMLFYQFDDFPRALKYGKEATTIPFMVARDQMFNDDMLGMTYLKMGKYDSAMLYFDKTEVLAKKLGLRNWLGIVNGNKGHVFARQHNTDSAIFYYQLGIDSTNHYHLFDNTSAFSISLARIYYDQKNYSALAALLPMAQTATWIAGTEKDRLGLYQLLKDYHSQTGNATAALVYSDSVVMWKDSVNARLGKNLQMQAELAHETEMRQAGEQLLEKEIAAQKLFRIVAVVIFLLVLFIGFQLYKQQRLKHAMQQQQYEARQQQQAQELILATQQLHEFTQIITEKNRLIELLEEQSTNAASQEQIQQLQNNTLLTDQQWNEFKELFEKVHVGFFNRLREKLPGLTPAETRFFALAKLKLTVKEMAASLGVSAHAVRTIWYRLRKKLNLPEEEGWEKLVDEI